MDKLDPSSKVCLLNSKDIFNVLKEEKVIIMACNTRIRHVIPGIMRAAEELDAVVAFELAKSEGHIDGGYTGQTPQIYFETIVSYAEAQNFTRPFFIHGDHITVKNTSEEEINAARDLIKAELDAGYTCYAIDASFNEIPDNIRITTLLAQPILEAGIGMEVEVGEIKSAGSEGSLTTVDEAVEFVSGLKANNVSPNLLAINNGSKHGNYLEGEPISIDLNRTGEIYEAIKGDGLVIAQHGITGTPLHLVGRFADYGIRKGNVGTHWQNIAHEFLPADLMADMKAWADETGNNIKMATKPFKEKIDSIPQENKDQIEEKAYQTAKEYFEAFRAVGTASKAISGLA
ncbi:MAG: class II fructose-bisphosphate aldolase [Deltaproteobacteria bacterium]|nr:class II fructose-bisphosphate aldolase [Deltaproteobacteria bacterium]MBW2052787.1 class II fructose-bisphosphate aldolase [Deltaproteobacteria bacterium]MBW2140423.1 class II fructose-bisphosphate aldolase [Deltaproteobacteria bacterium]MBW2323806.1 class II fructose-bisphosphate aldolase [Deltaproteobacteria bacterium]